MKMLFEQRCLGITKCDLDGKHQGLSAFIIPKKLSEDEIEEITYKIENNIPLDED